MIALVVVALILPVTLGVWRLLDRVSTPPPPSGQPGETGGG